MYIATSEVLLITAVALAGWVWFTLAVLFPKE